MLILLDNCEHVVGPAAVVSEALLATCPRIRILATSREPLRVAGERSYRLPSLNENEAVELFVDRAQATDAHFKLNDENRLTVAEICRRLDGIPLAVELAAARVSVLAPTAIAVGLDNCFRILGGGERTALPRQRTMRGAIDWSYGLLSASEQRLFERLSIFAEGCTFETASAVCADDEVRQEELLDVLSSLVEKSLVAASSHPTLTRYRLLEPFRQYAREKLTARGECEVTSRRQAVALLETGERLLMKWETAADPAWHELVAAEIADWRGVLDWSLGRRSDIPTGQRLVCVLQLLTTSNPPAEWQRWIALARSLAGPNTLPETLAGLSYAECILRSVLDQQELELACAIDSLARYRALNDELGIVRTEFRAARALFSLGRYPEGEPVVIDAIARARRLGLRKTLAACLLELARSYRECGAVSLARRYIAEARTIHLSVGATFREGSVAESVGLCELYEGKPEVAARYMFEAIPMYRAIGDMRSVAGMLGLTALCLCRAGDYDRAEAYARESLEMSVDHQLAVLVAVAIHRLVAVALLRGTCRFGTWSVLCERAARLFGFVDASLVAYGSPRFPHDKEEYESAMQVVREWINDVDLARLTSEGAAMVEAKAIEEALTL